MGNYSKIPLPIELSCDGSQSLLGFLHTNQDLKSKTLTETVTEQDCHHDKLFPVLFFFLRYLFFVTLHIHFILLVWLQFYNWIVIIWWCVFSHFLQTWPLYFVVLPFYAWWLKFGIDLSSSHQYWVPFGPFKGTWNTVGTVLMSLRVQSLHVLIDLVNRFGWTGGLVTTNDRLSVSSQGRGGGWAVTDMM